MRRRRLSAGKGSEHYATGADRWLVSYADYMTLAFALFVVLYALHANKTELQQPLLDGMEQAFVRLSGEAKPEQGANSMINHQEEPNTQGTGNPLTEDELSLAKLKSELELTLGPLLDTQQLTLNQEGEWLTLSFDGRLIFASGSALLSQPAHTILSAIVPALTKVDHFIQVRGFTDNLAVNNELYASNWQLSAERARAVLEWLQTHGINAARLSLMAFGEYQPPLEQLLKAQPSEKPRSADNPHDSNNEKNIQRSTVQGGRAQDRRVEIAIATASWQAPIALPSQPFAAEQVPGVRVFDLPSGGIRIGSGVKQDKGLQ
ncbi:OmpA family protein [Oceanisphaera avium]|uniref:OmpA-like domain-containing protein n=1 Tax=Oceanisphaera avium TaxID=1903694 RepID=A0A1Y0CWM8_9GAMM|nr:OmpA family protein [Oceanisphaera avium]ART79712.1 hypothetical protein CBP12_05735 [Oceanisphaera avium]